MAKRLVKKIFNKNFLILALLLVPVFFINNRDSHDWGGDFAMYIMQAGNIVKGLPQAETPYIYNPGNPVLGPPAYPIGFPLLLSPVYAIFGNSVAAFTYWITFFLFAFGLVTAAWLRKYFGDLVAIFLVLIIVYNPWTLNMKLEIMSEFPFALLLVLLVWLYGKYEDGPYGIWALLALLGGLLISVRTIGFVFPLALFAYLIRRRFFDRENRMAGKRMLALLIPLGAVLIHFILNRLVFAVPQADGGSYTGIWEGDEALYATVLYNLAYYTEQFKYFFSPWGGSWNFLPLMLKAAIFTFTLLGMIRSFSRKWELADMVVILYLLVLLVYPYRHAGIRFLFPLIPFLMVYLVRGLEAVSLFPGIRKQVKTVFLGLLVLVSYLNMFWYIVHIHHQTLPGPQEKSSQEAFAYIRDHTAANAVIIFAKPRVLALYTGRQSIANHKELPARDIADLIFEYGVNYVLVHEEVSDEAIKDFIYRQDYICDYEWNNDKFVLYKVVLKTGYDRMPG
jgi:4-amino-4-deoxy-L-arabinose transferase-like glycosyltransferase